MAKISEHPTAELRKKIEEQSKMIEALKIDVLVLKDLLQRTVRMLARFDMAPSKKGPKLLK